MPARLRTALPGWRLAIAGTVAWAAVLAASAAVWLLMNGRFSTSQWPSIVTIFALGGALAFVPALYATRLAAPAGPSARRFATVLLLLGAASVLGVAFVFSMQYRIYYAQWHEDFPSIGWVYQLLFTGAGAVYQFAVLGLRMFFPVAFVALFAFGLWHARRLR